MVVTMACCAVMPGAEAINTGPLEATIHNLGKDEAAALRCTSVLASAAGIVVTTVTTVACCAVMPGAEAINTGPLEATIHNLGKDIESKGREGQELQRRWITRQTELVALQVGSGTLDTRVVCQLACSSLLAQFKRAHGAVCLRTHTSPADCGDQVLYCCLMC
jgi:hypothetical protein